MNRDGFAAVSLRHPSPAPPSPRYPFDPQAGTVTLNPSAASASAVRCSTSLPKPAFHSRPHSREAPTRRGWPACRLAATTVSRARWSGCSSPSTDRRSLAATTRGAKVSSSPSPTVPCEQCLRRHSHHRARLQPDANLYEWTEAINAGYRSQLGGEFQILGVVERGFAKGLQGAGFGWSGFIVNCPVVFRLL
jgi:hypothetical protein